MFRCTVAPSQGKIPRGENSLHRLFRYPLDIGFECSAIFQKSLSISVFRMYEETLEGSYTGMFYLFLARDRCSGCSCNWQLTSEASQVTYSEALRLPVTIHHNSPDISINNSISTRHNQVNTILRTSKSALQVVPPIYQQYSYCIFCNSFINVLL
jgi:hypothetical protein